MFPRIAIAIALLFLPLAAVDRSTREDLVVHEWGTFTSVAGADGYPVAWEPLLGPPDLPCFVERLSPGNPKGRVSLVRMETPVLYFYSPRAVTLSVKVGFPKGLITEWYPHSVGFRNWSIEWPSVEVRPGETPDLPTTKTPNHYFAARETDAAPIRVGSQWEKLIFYRGVGDLDVPLRPVFTSSGKLKIRNSSPEAVPMAILFENRQGKLGYRVTGRIQDSVEVDAPELTGSLEQLRQKLAVDLMEFGLYRREALAMIETWKDSWFEEGMRLFYVMPRSRVNAALPLNINPAPSAITRVFVGRIEILSPWMRERIETAADKRDHVALMKFGRFLGPFGEQIIRSSAKPEIGYAVDALRRNSTWQACVE